MAEPLDLTQFEGHTPGDWRLFLDLDGEPISSHGFREFGSLETTVVVGTILHVDGEERAECEANQALTLAAPILLEECRRLRAENERLVDGLEKIDMDMGDWEGPTADLVRSLIAEHKEDKNR